MRRLRIILAAAAVVSLAAGHLLRPETALDERSVLNSLAPGAAFREKTGAPPLYRSDRVNAVAFNSHDVAPAIRGYAGPIKVMIVLGSDGVIRGIRIIEHRETKNYVHYLETPAWLGRFVGKSVFDRFEVDRDVDGISRATVSVEALARTVRDSSRSAAAAAFGITVAGQAEAEAGEWGWMAYAALFAAALAGYAATRRSRRYQRYRDGVLAAAIFIVGFHLSSPFSVLHIFNLALLRPSSSVLWSVIVASTVLSIIFAGRFYCGWLCPFGALAEFIGRLPVRKWSVGTAQDDRWRNLKYILLGAVTVAVFIGGRVEYGNYETYVTLFSFHGNALTWTLVAIALLANLRVERFWCRYLCPVAALGGALARQTGGYPSSPGCPMGNKPGPLISECIRCNRCYAREDRPKTAFLRFPKGG